MTELLDRSTFLHDYTGEAWIDEATATKLGKAFMSAYRWTAVTNAKTAMEAAWHGTLPLFTDPQYKDMGWASKNRTYKEPKDFLYPDEQKRMLLEMEQGAGATQYGYTLWESPQVFRHKALGPIIKLQSWPMNYWTRFINEQVHRAVKGSPTWDPGLKLPMSYRLRILQYLILGGLILNTLGYGRSFLFGTAPFGLPPTAKLMVSLYEYALTIGKDDNYSKRSRAYAKNNIKQTLMMHIPGYLTFKDAVATSEAVKGERPWSDLFFYKKVYGKQETSNSKGKP
jgi:hypothetical protein